MSIVSNINDAGIAETNRFIPIYPNKDQYYSALRTHFGDSFDTGGSDHFVSSMTDINTISDIYDLSKLNGGTGTDAALEQIRQKIHSKSNLYRWFSAVVCALIYGCDGTNQLSVANIPFDGGTNAYLNIWKDKFNRIGANGNHNDNPDFDSDTNRNGYNILQFGTGYEQMIGSFSTEYFVISLREMNLTGKTVNAWKEKYNFLCDANHSVHLLDQLNSLLNIRQKVLLKLSAMSIGANASKPMLLFKDLVLKYVDTNGIPLNPGIVHYNTVNGIKLYKIQNTVDLDRMIAENLYVGYHNAHDSCRFYALYPFTDEMIGALNHNRCTVSDIRLNIEKDPNSPSKIVGAGLQFSYTSTFYFVANPAVTAAAGAVTELPFNIPDIGKHFSPEHIKGMQFLHTFCMYPNLPIDYEAKCRRYVYFFNKDSMMMLDDPQGVEPVDFQKGGIYADTDGSGIKVKINTEQNMIQTGRGELVYTTEADCVDHFPEVRDVNGVSCGYIMNLTMSDGSEVPPLMEDGTPITITLTPTAPTPGGNFRAYVDFGSSSIYMRYSTGGTVLLNALISENRCTLRRLLTQYVMNEYSVLINDPVNNNYAKFPSASAYYDATIPVNDFHIYKQAFMPITKTFTEYSQSRMAMESSNKTALSRAGGSAEQSPNVIVTNLAYIIACNAVSRGYNDIMVVPSLPSSDYSSALQTVWNNAIACVNHVFPELNISNAQESENAYLLYESIAISNGSGPITPDHLQINIDIGDGTTDMSAIIVDNANERNMCGYSSIEYAGKDLMKRVLNDILMMNSAQTAHEIFMGQWAIDLTSQNPKGPRSAYPSSLFVPKPGVSPEVYSNHVKNLFNNFFSGTNRLPNVGKTWENSIIDLLSVSNLRNSIDLKIAANLVIRYAILMPVIKDFIDTSIKIAGDRFTETTSILINFYGGASQGLELLKSIDPRGGKSAYYLFEKYFSDYFKTTYGANHHIQMNVPQVDGKVTLINGMTSLNIAAGGNGILLSLPGAAAAAGPVIGWDSVNPRHVVGFGEDSSVHSQLRTFGFVPINGNPVSADAVNRARIQSVSSYYHSDVVHDPFKDLNTFYNEEIYGKLIDNHDGTPDVIECLLKDFTNNASDAMHRDINQELLAGIADDSRGNSFLRATTSSIYPEMMKSAVFMFAISKMLSKYHRNYRTDHPITKFDDVPTFEFGG